MIIAFREICPMCRLWTLCAGPQLSRRLYTLHTHTADWSLTSWEIHYANETHKWISWQIPSSHSNRYKRLPRQTTAFQWGTPWTQIRFYFFFFIRLVWYTADGGPWRARCILDTYERFEAITFSASCFWSKSQIGERQRDCCNCTLNDSSPMRGVHLWQSLNVCQSIYESILIMSSCTELVLCVKIDICLHRDNDKSNRTMRFWNSIFLRVFPLFFYKLNSVESCALSCTMQLQAISRGT